MNTKFIPKSLTRFGSRSVLKARKHSPTLLVVAGTVGLVSTIVVAVKASKQAEVVIAQHKAERATIGSVPPKGGGVDPERRKEVQVLILQTYYNTSLELARVYGPALVLGTLSAGSILYGHKILMGRHLATMTAYSGLMEQFSSYRGRVQKTLGEEAERDIYNGAHGEYVEDPNHKGEYKLKPVYEENGKADVRRPWFDETNAYFTKDPEASKMWLTGVQSHMNQLLQNRGHLFLNEVLDALNMERCAEGQQLGWVYGCETGDDFVDFGFLTSNDPHTLAFRNGVETTVRLNFNVDGVVWDLI